MSSNAATALSENKKDIEDLIVIHGQLSGTRKGKRAGNINVINRSGIVFVAACWESFVEDLATEAFDFFIGNITDTNVLSNKLKGLIGEEYQDEKNFVRVWDALAGSSWVATLRRNRDKAIEQWVTSLNTPKWQNVDALFENLLGLRGVSSSWTWQRMKANKAKEKLNDYITTRGNIAHRTRHSRTVSKNDVRFFINHVEQLAIKTEMAVAEHLLACTNRRPW